MKPRHLISRVFLAAALLLFMAAVLFPIYWALRTALLPKEHIATTPLIYAPFPPSGESFREVFTNRDFLLSVKHSALVAGGATLLSLVLGAMAACALGRYRFPGRRPLLLLLLSMTMFPQIAVVGALYNLALRLKLYDTEIGLMLSHLLLTLPFTVWVLTSFFKALPRELEESAYVDGASPFQTFWRVLLPLAAPGIATTGILAFITSWNEYLFALSLTTARGARTLPVAIAQFTGVAQYETPWGQIMAASLLATAPLILVVLLFQRLIVGGLTAGSVKG